MKEIKVGDEVEFKGVIKSINYEEKKCSVSCSWKTKFEGGSVYSFNVPLQLCQKIKHKFIITPDNVGRFAKDIHGNKYLISSYHIIVRDPVIQFVMPEDYIDGENIYSCNENGIGLNHRLTGWWDE